MNARIAFVLELRAKWVNATAPGNRSAAHAAYLTALRALSPTEQSDAHRAWNKRAGRRAPEPNDAHHEEMRDALARVLIARGESLEDVATALDAGRKGRAA